MTKFAHIIRGMYRNTPVVDTVLPVVAALKEGARGWFITVDGTTMDLPNRVRVIVDGPEMVKILDEAADPAAPVMPVMTMAERIERIRNRFEILGTMTSALIDGHARGLIVSGPPGIGKSWGIEQRLATYEALSALGAGNNVEVIKGAMTPVSLFMSLYEHKNPGDIVVFDDCDSILFDDVCLNLLKAALDSGKRRRISWRAESRTLMTADIPNDFDFNGSVIFITNLKFDNCRSQRLRDHLEALVSRCHYLDMAVDSREDLIARVRQVVADGMLDNYNFTANEQEEIVCFLEDNVDRMREISLRMVTKLADLRRMSATAWKSLAQETCMRRS
jgi:cellulose synthase/poly-beta-1,6-N-acetylglucosamine synthase-like glycosyltransferase